MKKVGTWIKSKIKYVVIAFIVLIVLLIIIGMAAGSKKDSKKKGGSDKEKTETVTIGKEEEYSTVTSPKIDNPESISNTALAKTEDLSQNEDGSYSLKSGAKTIGKGQGEKNLSLINKSHGYTFRVPEGYQIEYGNDNVYVRSKDENDTTQVSVSLIEGMFADGIAVWNHSAMTNMYRLKARLKGEQDKIEERIVSNYGAASKTEMTVGNYNVAAEVGELWFLDNSTNKNIVVEEYGYYTTINGKGLMIVGLSQTKSGNDIMKLMNGILETMNVYTPTQEDLAVEMKTFKQDGVSFNYPGNWTVKKDKNGMTYIKAPESPDSPYAGMVIEFLDGKITPNIKEHNDYARGVEGRLLVPLFSQTVSESDFRYDEMVNDTDYEAKLGEKMCTRFDITDNIFGRSTAAKNSMGFLKSQAHSIRYCFDAGKTPVMINFFIPENDNAKQMVNTIVNSISAP